MVNIVNLRATLAHARQNPDFSMQDPWTCFNHSARVVTKGMGFEATGDLQIAHIFGVERDASILMTTPETDTACWSANDESTRYISNERAFTTFENWIDALETDSCALPDWT